jgi:hypothetical protein
MTVILAAVLLLRERHLEPAVLWAAGFTLGELTVMTAVVVLFSTFASPALSGVFTLALFVMGNFAGDLLRFAEKMNDTAAAWGARGVYLLLPHLDAFNRRAEAAYGVVPDPAAVAAAAAYALLYASCLIAVGCAVFSVREFR